MTDFPPAGSASLQDVSIENLTDLQTMLAMVLGTIECQNTSVLKQLKLMNARLEEAFETGLVEEDV